MTYERFSAIAKRVKYKPGWHIVAAKLDDEVWIYVRARVRDAYKPHGTISVHVDAWFSLASIRTEASALRTIREAILSVEHHELGEWMRYRGKRPFDPHKVLDKL